MRVSDVMSRLQTVDVGESAPDSWELMRQKGVHHLAVTERGQVVGLVSHDDCLTSRAGQTVRDVMSAQVVTATLRTTVRQAADLMRGQAVGCLLVVDDEKPVGIVTVSDVLELVGKGAERPVAHSKRWIPKDRRRYP